MKRKLLCGIITIAMLLMVGCEGTDNKDTNVKSLVTDEVDKNDKDIIEEVNKNNKDNQSTNNKIEQANKIIDGELAIYTVNENIDV